MIYFSSMSTPTVMEDQQNSHPNSHFQGAPAALNPSKPSFFFIFPITSNLSISVDKNSFKCHSGDIFLSSGIFLYLVNILY